MSDATLLRHLCRETRLMLREHNLNAADRRLFGPGMGNQTLADLLLQAERQLMAGARRPALPARIAHRANLPEKIWQLAQHLLDDPASTSDHFLWVADALAEAAREIENPAIVRDIGLLVVELQDIAERAAHRALPLAGIALDTNSQAIEIIGNRP